MTLALLRKLTETQEFYRGYADFGKRLSNPPPGPSLEWHAYAQGWGDAKSDAQLAAYAHARITAEDRDYE